MPKSETEDAGVISRILSSFKVDLCVSDEQLVENVKSALGRRLPLAGNFRPHKRIMSIAGGGPSLDDTYKDLRGEICAINGSLAYLLERNVNPWACGLLDPRPHISEFVIKGTRTIYFVASICDPCVFNKLAGEIVVLWHPGGMAGMSEILPEGTNMIGGGCTMGLRWLNLGYNMGFREIHCHGFDSSFRKDKTHAYTDERDKILEGLELHGYRTAMNFIEQIDDWFKTKSMFQSLPRKHRPRIILHGDGLLQYCDKSPVRRVA